MSKPKTQECPRAAMLRVRSFVKQFMSGKKANKFTDLSKYPQNVADRNRTIIAQKDIVSQKQDSTVSQMPPGLANALDLDDFISLVDYLKSLK